MEGVFRCLTFSFRLLLDQNTKPKGPSIHVLPLGVVVDCWYTPSSSLSAALRAAQRVLSWGSSRARAAAETVACSAILAPFIASPAARRMVHGSNSGRKAMGGRTIAEEAALARCGAAGVVVCRVNQWYICSGSLFSDI